MGTAKPNPRNPNHPATIPHIVGYGGGAVSPKYLKGGRMKKTRTIARPWARRKRGGGFLFKPSSLLEALRQGDAVQLGDITVGTRELIKIIRGFELPVNQLLLVSSNGNLEISNVGLRYVPDPKGDYPRKAQHYTLRKGLRHHITLHDGAWLPENGVPKMTVVLRPKRF